MLTFLLTNLGDSLTHYPEQISNFKLLAYELSMATLDIEQTRFRAYA